MKLLLDEAAEGADGVAVTILEEAAGAVQRARVGSVSTEVIRAAQGPVLVYPHASADSEEANGG